MVIEEKRVATLYRVSTKGQLDENDIPMQERACRNFIKQKTNWVLVKEYYERGVSGFKVSASKRDAIQQAKEDAENKVFDVLLVFMFDRLGRRDDETPFIVEWFVNQGIEVWSVVEGQQKIEQHTDRLINYLRFWQSSGESRKTSERVDEKHRQMVEDGIFRGGGIPYGYRGVPSGKTNKKGKPLLKLIIDEEESKIVKLIYKLVLDEGYGQLRIAKYLNGENKDNKVFPTRSGKKWGSPTIGKILTNPIYKGIMKYEKTNGEVVYSSNPISDLIIIDDINWERVQELRRNKNPKNKERKQNTPFNTKGKLLLIGLARCGVCNSRLTSTYFTNKYKSKATGKVTSYSYSASYRCSGKLQGKTLCTGQSTFSARRVEETVLEEINEYLNNLKKVDLTNEINKLRKNNVGEDEKKLKKIESRLYNLQEELDTLNNEVPKAIMGKSSFKPELLNKLINEREEEINQLNSEIVKVKQLIDSKKIRVEELEELKKFIPVWKEEFNKASTEKKKMMLSYIIDTVFIQKDKIRINMKIDIQSFINSSCETEYSGRAPYNNITGIKSLIENIISVNIKNKKST